MGNLFYAIDQHILSAYLLKREPGIRPYRQGDRVCQIVGRRIGQYDRQRPSSVDLIHHILQERQLR